MKYILLLIVVWLLSGCTYVRPPAGEGVRQEHISGTTGEYSDQPVQWMSGVWWEELGKIYPLPARAKPILDGITLPDGFSIHVFAQVPNARSLALAYDENRNRQVIFVGTKDKWSVYALIDEGADNTVEEIKEIAKDLNQPNGVAFSKGNLYVAEVSKVHEFPDMLEALADTQKTSPQDYMSTVIYDKLPADKQHGRKYIAFWPEGDLYIPVGAPCNICDEWDPHGAITKLNIESWESQIVARGVRNTVGFSRHPDTKELRFTDNGRDNLGNDIPHDELNVIRAEQEHFGFPYCYDDNKNDPAYPWKDCQQYSEPQIQLWPHVAALWMKFYTGKMFPQNYYKKVFIAEHGSRNRKPPIWYRISLVDTEKKTYEIFAQGRLRDGKTRWRPVDVLELRDWSLLVSDDYAGLVYIVVYNENTN